MLEERFVRLRTYRNNIARYRRLLETDLTDFERQFIERRLSEEQSKCELLDATFTAEVQPRFETETPPAYERQLTQKSTNGLRSP